MNQVATLARSTSRRATFWWLAALVLVAINLRPAIVSVPPIVDDVRGAFGLSATMAGFLTALPVACMGVFAPAAAWASARWGTQRTMAGALALLAVATAVRPIAGLSLVFVATVLAGVGIAVGSALMPALVRARYPERIGMVTGLYTTALIGGALFAAGGTEPLRSAFGGSWRWALAAWAAPAVFALVVWVALRPALASAGVRATASDPAEVLPGSGSRDGAESSARGSAGSGAAVPAQRRAVVWSPWRDRGTWLATVYMGGQSLLYYAALAWLAARYTDLGWSVREAGALLALFSAAQVVAALVVPAFARHDARPAISGSLGITVVCLALIALVPLASPLLWTALLGIGVGANFALALTVVGQIAPTPEDTPRASGMAFFVGYLVSSVGPVAVGLMRDLTGDFRLPYLVLTAFGVVTLLAGVAAGARTRTR